MKELHIELPVLDTNAPQPPPTPSRYMVVVELVDQNDNRLKDIPHNPSQEEIDAAIKKYEEEHEWENKNWEAYIDEYRNPKG
jgi:hypothetical protein